MSAHSNNIYPLILSILTKSECTDSVSATVRVETMYIGAKVWTRLTHRKSDSFSIPVAWPALGKMKARI